LINVLKFLNILLQHLPRMEANDNQPSSPLDHGQKSNYSANSTKPKVNADLEAETKNQKVSRPTHSLGSGYFMPGARTRQ
jgi:hypothetical protein